MHSELAAEGMVVCWVRVELNFNPAQHHIVRLLRFLSCKYSIIRRDTQNVKRETAA
jgi:hypothetical protein